jgi:predicted nucleotidyltransferase
MPLDERILGFSNRWYKAAMATSATKRLREGLEIRVVTAPYFLATKLEAFKGRGGGDFHASHDLEDVMSVVDGRETLNAEVQTAGADLCEYLRRETASLLANPAFIDALPGFLLPDSASQARIGIVLGRLRGLASI